MMSDWTAPQQEISPATSSSGPVYVGGGADEERRPRVQSAARTIEILMLIAENDDGVEVKEICDRLHITRQIAYHMLHTLTSVGVVSRNRHRRYILGLRIGTLVRGYRNQILPASELAPIVRRVAEETGEITFASGWWEGGVTNFYIFWGTHPERARDRHTPYHMEHPHARAAGKLLLATAPPSERALYLDSHPLKRLTERTITNRRAFEREMRLVLEQGFATEFEESAEEKCSLALPLDDGMTLPFCIGLTVTASTEVFQDQLDDYVSTVRSAIAKHREW